MQGGGEFIIFCRVILRSFVYLIFTTSKLTYKYANETFD